jgi:hypothetical protein
LGLGGFKWVCVPNHTKSLKHWVMT